MFLFYRQVHKDYRDRTPGFDTIKQMFYFKDDLYWASFNKGLAMESLDTGRGYFRNTIESNLPMDTLTFAYQDNQPTPTPLNSVRDVNVLVWFDHQNQQQAEISWQAPEDLTQLGCTAWQSWKYDLTINENKTISSLNTTVISVPVDVPGQEFTVIVQAISSSGKSPESDVILVQSWPAVVTSPKIHLVMEHKIQTIGLLGDVQAEQSLAYEASEVLINKAAENNSLILSNDSHVFWNEEVIFKTYESSIESLAYEPFARAVYINLPDQNMLVRRYLECQEDNYCEDHLTIKGARKIQIDSLLAKLCWVVHQRTIKCSFLDTSDPQTIFQTHLHSEEHVLDISVDAQDHWLYFLIQGPDNITLHRFHLQKNEMSEIGSFSRWLDIKGKLQCFFDKCWWIQDTNVVTLFDVKGNTVSVMPSKHGLKNFQVDFGQITQFPSGMEPEDLQVLPGDPDSASLTEELHLVWSTNSTINFGLLYFDIKVSVNSETFNFESVSGTILDLSPQLLDKKPYTSVLVEIRSKTYWSKSRQTLTKVTNLPMGIPSVPKKIVAFWEPGVFQKFTGKKNILTTFDLRWERPTEPNGPISNYILQVKCSTTNCPPSFKIDGKSTQYVFNISSDSVVSQLELHAQNNQVLNGPQAVFVIKDEKKQVLFHPVPLLLVADQRGLALKDMNSLKTLTSFPSTLSSPSPKFLEFCAQRNKILYQESGQMLLMDPEKKQLSTSIDIQSDVYAFDPIGLYLYIVKDKQVYRKSLEHEDNPVVVYEADQLLVTVAIDPQASKNLYLVSQTGQIILLSLSLNGSVTSVDDQLIKNKCGMAGPWFSEVTASNGRLFFVQTESKKLWSFHAETESCFIKGMLSDLSLRDLTVINEDDVYWINATTGSIWSLAEGPIVNSKALKIAPFCKPCQTVPQDQENCLIPNLPDIRVLNTISDKITFSVQAISKKKSQDNCKFVMPPTRYLIKYSLEGSSSIMTKEAVQTANAKNFTVAIDKLRPYKTYQFEISAETSYGRLKTLPLYGQLKTLPLSLEVKTLDGQPSPPTSLKVQVLTPDSVLVTWKPSTIANGAEVNYEVHYQTNNSIEASMTKTQDSSPALANKQRFKPPMSVTLLGLEPSQIYKIWVVAKTKSANTSKSNIVEATTFAAPNLVTVTEATPRTLSVEWISPDSDEIHAHQIILRSEKTETQLPSEPVVTQSNQRYQYQATDLKPGTRYELKMRVFYKTSQQTTEYFWPQDGRQTFKTPADQPSTPGQPYLLEKHASIFITWRSNDSSVQVFELQAKPVQNSQSNNTEKWATIYLDSEDQWPITGMESGLFLFRVRAKSPFGWSDWSQESGLIDIAQVKNRKTALLSSLGPLIGGSVTGVALLAVVVVLFVLTWTRKSSEKKAILGKKKGFQQKNMNRFLNFLFIFRQFFHSTWRSRAG